MGQVGAAGDEDAQARVLAPPPPQGASEEMKEHSGGHRAVRCLQNRLAQTVEFPGMKEGGDPSECASESHFLGDTWAVNRVVLRYKQDGLVVRFPQFVFF